MLALAALAAVANAAPQICPSGSCSFPVSTLADPTTACQSTSLTLTCANPATYAITLVQGQTYTFTNCGATCAGSNAAFNSRIELYQGATLVASNTNACGTNGEVVYATDPFSGGGTYCVSVVPETGFGDLTLSWRVACQAPSNLVLSPTTAGATLPGCTKDIVFSVNSAGTGDFTYDWVVTPPPGGSVVPSTRTITRPENSDQFPATVTGLGSYAVQVTVSNDCGNDIGTMSFLFEDAAGPDITCTATQVACPGPPPPDPLARSRVRVGGGAGPIVPRADLPPAPGDPLAGGGRTQDALDRAAARSARAAAPAASAAASRSRAIAERLASRRAEIASVLFGATTEQQARELIARKLDLVVSDVVIQHGDDPRFFRPPGQSALSCPSPCTFGTLQATHPFYDVFLDCSSGAYTARTGASHSVTALGGGAQNVIYGGQLGSPGTSDISFQFHNNGTTFLNPSGGQACSFDPPDTAAEPNSIGLEQEWTLDPFVAGLQPVIAREEIVAFGSTEANSGVRLTLGVQNPASSTTTADIGVRWQIDYQNSFDDGPGFATVLCSPFTIGPERFTEHEFSPGEIQDFYRIQNNTGAPIFANFTSTAPISGFPDTATPDRLVYGAWPSMSGSPWNYPTLEGSNADFDSATLVYYGYAPADALAVAPGRTVTRSVVIFTQGAQQSCGEFIPGTGAGTTIDVCQDTCVEIGATATDNCSLGSVLIAGTSIGAPTCTGNPCTINFPSPGTYTYTWRATDTAGNATTCDTRVNVIAGPSAVLAPVPSSCEGSPVTLDATGTNPNGCTALEFQWSDAGGVVRPWDPSPTYGPFVPPGSGTWTVEVRCAAATGCISSATRAVTVTAFPIARVLPVGAICAGGTVAIDASLSDGAGCTAPLEYQFSDGTGVLQPWSTTATYPVTPGSTTTYTVEVRCPTNVACVASTLQTVAVVPIPTAAATGPGAVCAGTPVTLDASSSSGNGCPLPLEYQLRDGAVVLVPWGSTPLFGPLTPGSSTTYTVDVRCPAAQPACSSSVPLDVTVVPVPVAVAGPDASVCRNASLTLDGSGSSAPGCAGGALYEWRQGATVVRPASPVATYNPPTGTLGTTVYTLVVSCGSLTSCQALDDVAVQIRNCTMAVRFDTYAAVWLGDGSGVEVTWRTLEELDTSFFVVERSASSWGPWSGVGDPVSAVGPGYPYRFVDATAAPGTRPWYRIVEHTSSGRGDQTPAFETR